MSRLNSHGHTRWFDRSSSRRLLLWLIALLFLTHTFGGELTPPALASSGISSSDISAPLFAPGDADNDGIPDATDPDDDNDGIPDTAETNGIISVPDEILVTGQFGSLVSITDPSGTPTVTSLPTTSVNLSDIAFTSDGTLWGVGGADGNRLYRINRATSEITLVTTLPGTSYHALAGGPDGKLYAGRLTITGPSQYASVRYDPATNTSSSWYSFPFPPYDFVFLNGKVYTILGVGGISLYEGTLDGNFNITGLQQLGPVHFASSGLGADANGNLYTHADTDNDTRPELERIIVNNNGTITRIPVPNTEAPFGSWGLGMAGRAGAGTVVNDIDTDGDGIPNRLDTDSDNDGINDNVECPGQPCRDTDNDGTPDFGDTDSDNDGISDQIEGVIDTDGDGTPNYRDTDSDNDGINDSVECPGQPCRDTDNDGTPDYRDTDSDGDGIPDQTEGTADSDRDGLPDYRDPDSDNDGISDQTESTADTDGDGLPNRLEPNNRDTDGDGSTDNNDANDDGDAIPTRDEGGADGIVNDDDADGDNIPDHLDSSNGTNGDSGDSDGDGINDNVECPTGNPCRDSDNDGTPDYQDDDSDNDGFTDEDENNNGTDPTNPNSIPGVAISAKVLLQGALLDPNNPAVPLSVMRDDLRSRNLLPLTSPYTGTAVVTATAAIFAANGNDSVVDWVQLELRNATTPSTIVATLAALVQRDGDVMDVTGSTTLVFRGVTAGSYLVAVSHRNHLGAMTAAPVSLTGTATLVDFTNTAADFFNAAANLNGVEQATVGGKFALWTGDANGDGRVAFSGQNNDVDAIFTAIDQAPGNLLGLPSFVLNGYRSTDIDLTGSTIFTGEDVNTIFNTIDSHPRNLFGLPTYVIVEQLP